MKTEHRLEPIKQNLEKQSKKFENQFSLNECDKEIGQQVTYIIQY